jgi:D-glycero-D-manno-heptose 1,7-bisphosphate phosphatase
VSAGPGRPLAILDRDGTLIDFVRDPDLGVITPAFHPAQLRLLPGVREGLLTLVGAGFTLAVATNQPDAAKGRVPRESIARTNDALLALLAGEGVVVEALACCLHHPDPGPGAPADLAVTCGCRKPAPGLLLDLLQRLGGDPARSWMIGDTAADLGAARAAGLRCGLVMVSGRCELCPLRDAPAGSPDRWAPRLDELARAVVAHTAPSARSLR